MKLWQLNFLFLLSLNLLLLLSFVQGRTHVLREIAQQGRIDYFVGVEYLVHLLINDAVLTFVQENLIVLVGRSRKDSNETVLLVSLLLFEQVNQVLLRLHLQTLYQN